MVVGRPQTRFRTAALYVLLVLLGAFFIVPWLYMVVGAFKPGNLALAEANTSRALWPTAATLENFADAFHRAQFGRALINSTIISSSIVTLGLMVNSMMGYALARLPFRGARAMFLALIAFIIIPFDALAIPLLWMTSEVGLRNTYTVQIVPFVANPLFVYLFYTFFLQLPRELEEAARVDGAGPFRVFVSIAVPLAAPAYATVAILSFLFNWGNLMWPVMVTIGPSVRPLAFAMAIFRDQFPIEWGAILAFATMMTLPLLLVFVVFQRWFVQSVSRSGLKG
jgi:multiple sugar transport system permease protein